jgi:hypothetical protein
MKQSTIEYLRNTLGAFLVMTLVACGGGGGGDGGGTTTATGYFKDSNVAGLTFTSGAQSGVTGADGSFTYEVGQSVSFNLGGVNIGDVAGKSVVTPLDLVSNGTSSTQEVVNIVRFLMMLDSDGDPSNGINISAAVQAAADGWSPVNFSAADLATELAVIMADANAADGITHALPNSNTAQGHLESTLNCVRSGIYHGTYSGTDRGGFSALVDAADGLVSGFAFSSIDQWRYELVGTTAVSHDQSATFITGNVSSGASFSGRFTGPDSLAGSWSLAPHDSGLFSGGRIGGSAGAVYRFTGTFSGDSHGLLAFNIDAANHVSGVAYTAYDLYDYVVNEIVSFSGTLSGPNLTAYVYDGNLLDATITGTLDKDAGTVSGSWSDQDGHSGIYSGSGCRLN